MIAFTLILFVVLAAGALALAFGLKRAVEGYEDETGFHAKVSSPQVGETKRRQAEPETAPASRPLAKKPLRTGPAAA